MSMFDKPFDYENGSKFEMGIWIGRQMAYGAFLGSIPFLLGLGLVLGSYGLGLMLPERAHQAPSPYTTEVVVQPATEVV